MSKTAVIYFSGTGNTRVIAEALFRSLSKTDSCELFAMEDILNGVLSFNAANYDLLGIGYPIYGFNAPGIAFDFVRCLPENVRKDVFLFSTCAGPLYFNDIASFPMKKRLGQKGWKVFYERQFYMPANIATPYRDAVVKQLHDAAMKKAGIMAVELCNRKERLRNDRIFPYFLFWLRFIEKLSWKTVPLDFYVKKSCTSCGLCVSLCPRRNIKLKANGIRFGLNCLACYRCVYRCPNRAISGRLYGFAIFKKGYDIRRIVDSEEIRGEFINENTKGYYRIFLRYLTGED